MRMGLPMIGILGHVRWRWRSCSLRVEGERGKEKQLHVKLRQWPWAGGLAQTGWEKVRVIVRGLKRPHGSNACFLKSLGTTGGVDDLARAPGTRGGAAGTTPVPRLPALHSSVWHGGGHRVHEVGGCTVW